MDLQETYEKLLRYCCMKTGDRYLAEDIVQETFLRFWTNRTYKDTGRETAYLYTIAKNLCLDAFRKPRMECVDDHLSTLADGEQGERVLDHLAVEEALASLPEDVREIITLRYISEVSVTDISRITQLSRFAVRRRIREGLRMLKERLADDE